MRLRLSALYLGDVDFQARVHHKQNCGPMLAVPDSNGITVQLDEGVGQETIGFYVLVKLLELSPGSTGSLVAVEELCPEVCVLLFIVSLI